eukprot:scaffold209566_cov33-Tisochrysis_lutea.AAC.1
MGSVLRQGRARRMSRACYVRHRFGCYKSWAAGANVDSSATGGTSDTLARENVPPPPLRAFDGGTGILRWTTPSSIGGATMGLVAGAS